MKMKAVEIATGTQVEVYDEITQRDIWHTIGMKRVEDDNVVFHMFPSTKMDSVYGSMSQEERKLPGSGMPVWVLPTDQLLNCRRYGDDR